MIRRVLIVINFILSFSLLISVFSKYINPISYWFFAPFGIAFFYLLIGNLIFAFAGYLLKNKFLIGFSTFALLIASPAISDFIQFSNVKPIRNEKSIKLLTYNVKVFDMFDWDIGPTTAKNILEFLKNENADIICLQEYYMIDSKWAQNEYPNLKNILKYQNEFYHYATYKNSQPSQVRGTITLSKFPIINSLEIKFDSISTNKSIITDIVIETDTIRVFNLHLESNNKSEKYASKLDRFKNGIINRTKQAKKIEELIEFSPYKTIVCGDFNDTPTSYPYQIIKNNLKDGYNDSGNGFGDTYTQLPFFKIDHILLDNSLNCYNYQIHKVKYSDHFPSTCIIEL